MGAAQLLDPQEYLVNRLRRVICHMSGGWLRGQVLDVVTVGDNTEIYLGLALEKDFLPTGCSPLPLYYTRLNNCGVVEEIYT